MTMQQRIQSLTDFEIERGKNAIHVDDIRRFFNIFPYGSSQRAYLILLYCAGCRVSEPYEDIRWQNFNDNGELIYRPNKTGKQFCRYVRLPERAWEELQQYRDNNFFPKGRLFPGKAEFFRRQFNKKYRRQAGGNWLMSSGKYRMGKVAEYGYYTIGCFRCTAATTIFHLFLREYPNQPDMALYLTSRWLGHGKGNGHAAVTAYYYLKRKEQLGLGNKLDEVPSGLALFDWAIYEQGRQKKLTETRPHGTLDAFYSMKGLDLATAEVYG